MVYQYTRKKFAKIPKNTQNSSKYTQNYTQVYFIPEIQRKWYTEYPYLSCNIPYTRFKKPLYTVYPKTLADPEQEKNEKNEAWLLRVIRKFHSGHLLQKHIVEVSVNSLSTNAVIGNKTDLSVFYFVLLRYKTADRRLSSGQKAILKWMEWNGLNSEWMINFVCHKFQTIWSLSFVTVISEIWGISDLHKFQSIKQLMQRNISFYLRMRIVCSWAVISLVWTELTQALNFRRCPPVLTSWLKQLLRQHNSYSDFFRY